MVRLARERGGNPDDPHRRAPARLRAVAAVARGRARLARAVRGRPPRLAHRVLGDVDARARPHPRPARWRHRPHLPAPRVRDRAERIDHRQAVRQALAALGDGELRGREDVEIARQPRVRQRPVEGARTRARSGSHCCVTTTVTGSTGTTPTWKKAPRCSTDCWPPPNAIAARIRGRSRSESVTRSTTISTHHARSTRSTISPARSSPEAMTRTRTRCCASSDDCSASTSNARSASARRTDIQGQPGRQRAAGEFSAVSRSRRPICRAGSGWRDERAGLCIPGACSQRIDERTSWSGSSSRS